MLRYALVVVLLTGCSATAMLYPANEQAVQVGAFKIGYTDGYAGHGDVKFTVPTGETFDGKWQMMDTGSVGFGLLSGFSSFGGYGASFGPVFSSSGMRPGVVDALGDRGTIIHCDFAANVDGGGAGLCRLSTGAEFRMQFGRD